MDEIIHNHNNYLLTQFGKWRIFLPLGLTLVHEINFIKSKGAITVNHIVVKLSPKIFREQEQIFAPKEVASMLATFLVKTLFSRNFCPQIIYSMRALI